MADIFISYSTQDSVLTINLAEYLEFHGYSTWWDTRLLPGEEFPERIKDEISISKAVIVIWTHASVKSKWVRAEAFMADGQKKLITVRADNFDPKSIPLPFNTYHTASIAESERILFACKRYIPPKPSQSYRGEFTPNTLPQLLKESVTSNNLHDAEEFVKKLIEYKFDQTMEMLALKKNTMLSALSLHAIGYTISKLIKKQMKWSFCPGCNSRFPILKQVFYWIGFPFTVNLNTSKLRCFFVILK